MFGLIFAIIASALCGLFGGLVFQAIENKVKGRKNLFLPLLIVVGALLLLFVGFKGGETATLNKIYLEEVTEDGYILVLDGQGYTYSW